VPEYHDIDCPNCGETRRYPETMTLGGRSCGCGAVYRIDTENWTAVEIIK
jgi:hypothetical protein